MLRSVAFEGVVLQVPSNVEVGVESGELTLSFSNFSGDVSVRPKKRKSPDEQETEQGGKRIALSQAAGSDFVFPNGGRSPFKNGGQGGSQSGQGSRSHKTLNIDQLTIRNQVVIHANIVI